MAKVNHNKIIKKNLNKFRYHLNISTIEEYLTISVISLIRNIPVKHLVNNPEVKVNGMVSNMRDYVRLEEVQYLIVKKDLTMTENCDLNEDRCV